MKRRKPSSYHKKRTQHSTIFGSTTVCRKSKSSQALKSKSEDIGERKKNEDNFDFLETLFDIQNELIFPESINDFLHGRGDFLPVLHTETNEKSYFKERVEGQVIDEQEFNQILNSANSEGRESNVKKSDRLDVTAENLSTPVTHRIETVSLESLVMAEEGEEPQIEQEENAETTVVDSEKNTEQHIQREEGTEEDTQEEKVDGKPEGFTETKNEIERGSGKTPNVDATSVAQDAKDTILPEYSIPSIIDLGISKQPEERDDSIISISLADPTVLSEMRNNDERILTIGDEIQRIKEEIINLNQKPDLTEDDTKRAYEMQESLMKKLAQCEEMTRKLQRAIGLTNPSSRSFADMFNMLPYPHWKSHAEDEPAIEDEKKKEKEETKKFASDENKFQFPHVEYPEDKLPRVIVCGKTEENIPKLVVADSKKRHKGKSGLQSLAGKLNESLYLQERLAEENAELEDGKYKLAEALLEKDKAIERLERRICGLQAELRLVVRENTERSRQIASLNERVQTSTFYKTAHSSPRSICSTPRSTHAPTSPCCCSGEKFKRGHGDNTNINDICDKRLSGGGSTDSFYGQNMNDQSAGEMYTKTGSSRCPSPCADIESKFAMCADNSKHLEEQLKAKECEVRNLQLELSHIQRERMQLVQQRKLLKCAGPCAPCSCCPPPSHCRAQQQPQMVHSSSTIFCQASKSSLSKGALCAQQKLRELQEQYCTLQEDYKNKICEVSCLRADAEKLKNEVREAVCEKERIENKLIDVQERLKIMEEEKNKFYGSKEQMIEQEQALMVAKRRFREAQDELEELRTLVQEHAVQVEDYRNKYLQAQQQVEEQKRLIDMMEMDNARMNENITLEISRLKNQFQEKLAELAPLPDILKQTQLKLQETQQLRMSAEHNCEDFSREVLSQKEKIQNLESQIEILRSENQAFKNERNSGKNDDFIRQINELRNENERLKNSVTRQEEQQEQLKDCLNKKLHEIAQLSAMLEQVREDSARQVARTKERYDAMRKSMQNQISEMEKELVQCRAAACAAQKDRDEVRQKMQKQINNLNESFEQAQGRIKLLQGHVNFLKDSCNNFQRRGQIEIPPPSEPSAAHGYDSCNCNH